MHIALAVFPIIFLGELPDKTMFASLVLGTRGRPFSVWCGAAAAFAVHVTLATTIGVVLFHALPHRAVEGLVAAVFAVGALLAALEARRARDVERSRLGLVEARAASIRRTVLTAFVVIFIAEWGDLTQLLTADLAAQYHAPLPVACGALAALWGVAAIAVIGGKGMPRFVGAVTLRAITAVVLGALAVYSIVVAVT